MTDPFSLLGESQARSRREAPEKTDHESERERSFLERQAARLKKEARAPFLETPDGQRLLALAKTLDLGSAELFLDTIAEADWLLTAEKPFREVALSILDDAIIALRIKAGLDPFDDPLPWGDDKYAFGIIKELLRL